MHAAAPASDDAADPVYDDGWQPNDDGGTGWAGGWILATNQADEPGEAGHQVESSTTNGDGDSDASGDIDTAGRAWGLFTQRATGTQPQASALRYLANGSLEIGQTLSLELDHGFDGVGFVGFDLLAGGSIRFDFRWSSGDDTYSYLTAQGTLDSGVAATDEGVRVEFTPTGADSFSLDVTPLDGRPTTTLTGELFQSGGIDLLRVFLQADATGVRADAFANRIAVPEPGVDAARTAALVLVLVLALGFRASATRFPRGRSRSGPGAGFPPGSRASPRGAARAG
ncbi:MAG TPA: hypothetical protein VFG80_08760 [Myxococcota bacterium]|nr:hypothetical protein [Myxococcota bacterium]